MKETVKKILKSKAFAYLRIAVGVALIVFLFKIADFEKVKTAFYGARKGFIVIALIGLVIDRFSLAFRWRILLSAKGIQLPVKELLKAFFISYFFGNFLPSTLAPDVIRIHRVNKYSRDIKTIVTSTVVDRMVGSFTLALIIGFALITVMLSQTLPIDSKSLTVSIVFLIASIFLPLILWHSRMRKLADYLLSKTGILKKIHSLYEAFYSYRHQKRALLKVFIIAFLNMLNKMVIFLFLFAAFSYVLPFIYFLLFMPVTWLAGIVPISVGELGILEGGVVFLFSQIGIPLAVCLAVGIIYRMLWLVVTLPGGVVFLLENIFRQKADGAVHCPHQKGRTE